MGTTARFVAPIAVAISPDGTYALITDGNGDDGPTRIRRIIIDSWEVTTVGILQDRMPADYGGDLVASIAILPAAGCFPCRAGWHRPTVEIDGGGSVGKGWGCRPCFPGTRSAGRGAVRCERCGAGEYQTGWGFDRCTACGAGMFHTGMGATAVLACKTNATLAAAVK
jgi:hypothetical protein